MFQVSLKGEPLFSGGQFECLHFLINHFGRATRVSDLCRMGYQVHRA
jgi:hypothetical protein